MRLKFSVKNKNRTLENPNTLDWLPVKEIRDGIIVLKNGRYVKAVEVSPVNFLLSSQKEKHNIIKAFRALLNICDFPLQILVRSWKADTQPHIKRMEAYHSREPDENCRRLIQGYIRLVRNIGSKNAVSRRFFIVFPYIPDPGVKTFTFEDVVKKLNENKRKIAEYISHCGNRVLEPSDEDSFTAGVLYTAINRKKSVTQPLPVKLDSLLSPVITGIIKD